MEDISRDFMAKATVSRNFWKVPLTLIKLSEDVTFRRRHRIAAIPRSIFSSDEQFDRQRA